MNNKTNHINDLINMAEKLGFVNVTPLFQDYFNKREMGFNHDKILDYYEINKKYIKLYNSLRLISNE